MLLPSMSAESSTPELITAENLPSVTPLSAEPAPDASSEVALDAAPSAPPELSEGEVEREIAALLFASPDPLSVSRLSALLSGVPTSEEIGRAHV